MASHVGLSNNLTDSSMITLRASWILHSAKEAYLDTSFLTIYLLLCLCFFLSCICALIISSQETPERRWLPWRGCKSGSALASTETTLSIHSSHWACVLARKRVPCKCPQGSSTTFPLMLNKVLKSNPLCKCRSYYQVGVLWFSSGRAQLLEVAGIRSRSWTFSIQLCRGKTDRRAWHTAMKEDAIWFGKLAPGMMQLPYVPRCQISNGAEWPDPDLWLRVLNSLSREPL